MTSVVSTSTTTASVVTGSPSQRKIDRCSNGVLWTVFVRASTVADPFGTAYSTDGGTTWIAGGNISNGSGSTTWTYSPHIALFIDLDDYAHVVFKDNQNGFIYYRRGTPNAGRTSYSWSSSTQINTTYMGRTGNYDIVAHRQGTGWKAHIAGVWDHASGNSSLRYVPIDISAAQIITKGTEISPGSSGGLADPTTWGWPALDFNHIGDGKTVKDGTPNLYLAFSHITSTSGIQYTQANYFDGAWTWGTIRALDVNSYLANNTTNSMSCMFDGTAVIVGGNVKTSSVDGMALWEIDDKNSFVKTWFTQDTSYVMNSPSMTYDFYRNVHFFGHNGTQITHQQLWREFGSVLSAPDFIANAGTTPNVSVRRGYEGNKINLIFTDSLGASPWTIKHTYFGEVARVSNPETIATSTATTATAYSNQRKLDRCQNGVLWMLYWYGSGTGLNLNYSTDNGTTWVNGGAVQNGSGSGTQTYAMNGSFFIDLDDYAHVVFKDNSDGFIYYRRGTPNAGRTAWTWSAAVTVCSSAGASIDPNYPDIVAHREGTGWAVHVVFSHAYTTPSNYTRYARLSIDSGGVITVTQTFMTIGGNYSLNIPTWPSIDFNHTGDGKTVAGSTPHLYAAWSAGATGAGKGIRFKKAAYSAGTWTWGTEREIDSTRYVQDGSSRWLNCLFDGTRVIIGAQALESDGYNDIVVYERDAADTTTTTRVLINGSSGNNVTADYLHSGSVSYDSSGNIYLFGVDRTGANGTRSFYYRKWTRATTTLGAHVVIDGSAPDNVYVSAKRGYSNNRIEFIYTDGTTSPYVVKWAAAKINEYPTAPTSVNATPSTVVSGNPETLTWVHNDPDGDPQNRYKLRWRKV